MIGLNVDSDPEATVAGFLQQTGATYPNYFGGVPVVEKLFASDELTVPLTLLLDEDGVVTELIPGWSAETRRRFAALAGMEAGAGAASSRSAPKETK